MAKALYDVWIGKQKVDEGLTLSEARKKMVGYTSAPNKSASVRTQGDKPVAVNMSKAQTPLVD